MNLPSPSLSNLIIDCLLLAIEFFRANHWAFSLGFVSLLGSPPDPNRANSFLIFSSSDCIRLLSFSSRALDRTSSSRSCFVDSRSSRSLSTSSTSSASLKSSSNVVLIGLNRSSFVVCRRKLRIPEKNWVLLSQHVGFVLDTYSAGEARAEVKTGLAVYLALLEFGNIVE